MIKSIASKIWKKRVFVVGVVLILLVLNVFVVGVINPHNFRLAVDAVKNTGEKPIPAKEYQKLIGVGINVDWMNFKRVNTKYFYWHDKGVNVPEKFKERGFSSVRIRVKRDLVNNTEGLNQLKTIVNDCLNASVVPIITYIADDLREYPTNASVQEHFVQWWQTVARYFNGTSYLLSYDLLIESSHTIKKYPGILNSVYNQTISAIRKIDPYRVLFVTPANVSSPWNLNQLNVTWDNYTMVEWHIYAGGPRNCKYNTTFINESVTTAVRWSARTGIPTWLGAWRPEYYPKDGSAPCPIPVAVNFSKAMVSALNGTGIPDSINADVHFFYINNLTWNQTMKPVLDVVLSSPAAVPELSAPELGVLLVAGCAVLLGRRKR